MSEAVKKIHYRRLEGRTLTEAVRQLMAVTAISDSCEIQTFHGTQMKERFSIDVYFEEDYSDFAKRNQEEKSDEQIHKAN